MSEIVYFARRGDLVKIGTTGDLSVRLSNLKVGHSGIESQPNEAIEVLATMPGGRGVEQSLHKLFVQLHYAKEWFWWRPPLTDFVAAVRAATDPGSAVAETVTLQDAVLAKLVPWSYYALRRRLHRARAAGKPGVPEVVARVGQAYLYRRADLIAWAESELIP
jgi:hypothetical protein